MALPTTHSHIAKLIILFLLLTAVLSSADHLSGILKGRGSHATGGGRGRGGGHRRRGVIPKSTSTLWFPPHSDAWKKEDSSPAIFALFVCSLIHIFFCFRCF
ncbi:hypothetical protein Salat_0283100 [Sesamum alatum]|uniref:Transmembrane protein n=1 Tax=Sesamum alatum TaxID=300844 RepID=A0AAE1Z066_9LAMI|nr:hypothetical protein Salat_0283100 [Sesamum alatum]